MSDNARINELQIPDDLLFKELPKALQLKVKQRIKIYWMLLVIKAISLTITRMKATLLSNYNGDIYL
jgi:hypothetical protein